MTYFKNIFNCLIMKRIFDTVLVFFILAVLVIPIIALLIVVCFTSSGPILYWSDRVGMHGKIFRMPKFRTMKVGTPVVATHLLHNPENYLTPVGSFLRRYSLDELPQLWSIIIGDMSFVGPRPALFNQSDLINARTQNGIDQLIPGLTGWAQVNGRDDLSIADKVRCELEYLQKRSFWFDIKILALTFFKVAKTSGISH